MSAARAPRARPSWLLPALLVLAVLVAVAIVLLWRSAWSAPGNPLAGQEFAVDPDAPAADQAARWREDGWIEGAEAMSRIAGQPTARWLSTEPGEARAEARDLVARAAAEDRSALLVVYHIPQRDCGRFSQGGAGSAGEYRSYVDEVAGGIAEGSGAATVIVEPDAAADTVDCPDLDAAAVAERQELLRYAVGILAATPGTHVYLDGGNPGWVEDPSVMASALRDAGVEQADGFALNVSNFHTTEATIAYGTAVSERIGGTHFVIDTARNGNGPLEDGTDLEWCNPAGRVLGVDPTTDTGHPLVDAYLWVKYPGESDGDCGRGEPPAGEWWPDYAARLTGVKPW